MESFGDFLCDDMPLDCLRLPSPGAMCVMGVAREIIAAVRMMELSSEHEPVCTVGGHLLLCAGLQRLCNTAPLHWIMGILSSGNLLQLCHSGWSCSRGPRWLYDETRLLGTKCWTGQRLMLDGPA